MSKGSDKSGNHKGINRCRLGNATANNIRIYLVVISSFCISTSNGLTEKIHANATVVTTPASNTIKHCRNSSNI